MADLAAEAIDSLGLKVKTPARPVSKPGRRLRAQELATKAIEKIIDPAAPPEERARRRRPPTKGPPEFREARGPTEGEGEMTANAFVFTIEIGGTPTLTFEAQNLREAHELCHEQWPKDDLAEAKSDGVPLWDGKAKLRARVALPEESVLFTEAKNNGQPSDGLMLVYLVELDGSETDEQPVDPGAFPPART